jgi:hypothetical protein
MKRIAPFAAAVAFLIPIESRAADIATVLGTPGTVAWENACLTPADTPGPLSYGVVDCAPLGAFWEPICLHRVDIDPIDYPTSTCGDGTPGFFYVRPGPSDPDRWVIHLQGGGGCRDEATCQARWCGQDGAYSAAQMSSDWNADGTEDPPAHALTAGIGQVLGTNGNNDFIGWTHVFVPYCSNDLWQGHAGDVDLGAFTVDARGHRILHTVRRMLRKLGPAWSTAGNYPIPDLDAATHVLFTGTSAGGYGALQNADWFLQPLTAQTGLVVDAAMDISPTISGDYDLFAENTGLYYDEHTLAQYADRWAPGGYYAEIDAFVDESCRGAFPGNLEECVSPSKLLLSEAGGLPMVETPTFVRMDLQDNVLSHWYTDLVNPDGDTVVMGGSGGPTPTIDDYAAMMRDTMVELHATTDVSVHAPKCGVHVGLELENPFYEMTTPDSTDVAIPVDAGNDATVHDAIFDWFDLSLTDVRRIDTDEPGVSFSFCP